MEWSYFEAVKEAFGPGLDRFTERAFQVLAAAREEANARHHPHLTPEHLLLALARVGPSVAQATFRRLGVDLDQARGGLEGSLGALPPRGPGKDVARSQTTRKLLSQAEDQAQALGHDYVGTEHLALALLMSGGGAASDVLGCRGVTAECFRQEVLRLLAGS